MKTSSEEIDILNKCLGKDFSYPIFTSIQESELNQRIQEIRKYEIRKYAQSNPHIHTLMQALPLMVLVLVWGFLIFILPALISEKALLIALLGLLHGFIGYQWVVYGMHEGAGHGLFRNRNSKLQKFLNWLAYNSCRLLMADPEFYQKAHVTHHRYVGTIDDQAQTNYVHNYRVLISLLPGAGILFPNDYRIHKGDENTKSLAISGLVGGLRLALEIYLLSPYLEWYWSLLALAFIGPWVGLGLDRIRESVEHHLMPAHKIYGTRELGVAPMALILGGGPWGQSCHFCHHLAQDLNWYQQIWLHFEVKKVMNKEQREFYGFDGPSMFSVIINNIKSRIEIQKKYYSQKGIS